MTNVSDPREILDFWFSDEVRERWFDSTAAFDRDLRRDYEDGWRRARRGELDHWRRSADGCLALVILLDQFPLNMFRGEAESFATEAQSREVAREALERGFDRELPVERRAFLYMPFMHSEDLDDQHLSVELYAQPGLEKNHRFAKHHRDIIRRFGRFPHRNAALGRASTAEETEYLDSKSAFKG